MPSRSRSVGGTAIMASLPPVAGIVVIAPVMSLIAGGGGAACGGTAVRVLSSMFGAEKLFDCFSTGVGEIIKGAGAGAAGIAGMVLLSAGAGARIGAAGSLGCSIVGSCSTLPVSSSVIAILNVPSTITTTLAPTSSERILEDMVDGILSPALSLTAALALSPPLFFGAALERPAFSGGGAAAAACAARRAAAMKLDELTGSFGAAAISLITFSEAAIRSDGDDMRPDGRVPGSSG